jgi:hypothetical protein
VEDHGEVDDLLHERTDHRNQPASRRERRSQQRQAHPGHRALQRDPARASSDVNCVGETVDAVVDDDDGVGDLHSRGGTPCAQPTSAAARAGASL